MRSVKENTAIMHAAALSSLSAEKVFCSVAETFCSFVGLNQEITIPPKEGQHAVHCSQSKPVQPIAQTPGLSRYSRTVL